MAETPREDEDTGTEESIQSQRQTTRPDLPGRRLKNPLGYFSSSTYQISLYMITPDAYDAFIASGRRQIDAISNVEGNRAAGAYLIAQSGGINSTDSRRAPGFDLDYYIDNLTIKTYMDPQSTMTSSNTTEVKFQIVEPYGFSFLTKLRQATDSLQEYVESLNAVKTSSPRNPTRQFFILGVRFLGYDENGNIVTGAKIVDNDLLDANATPESTALFDRYYDINITNVKFKVDGTASTYNVDAIAMAPQVAFGIKRGRINNDTTVVGSSVESVLTDLVNKLNKASEDNSIGGSFNSYEIVYVGDNSNEIREAKILLPEDLDKSKMPMTPASSTTKVTQATEDDDAQPDIDARQIVFKGDTAIQQAISQVISQSTYLRNALLVVYESTKQPDDETGDYKKDIPEDIGKRVSWYNLSAEVSDAIWNEEIADFVYNIKFIIQTYETPVIDNAYTNSGARYYGPHKRYEYWYTGKNSEILSYEQVINNGYFTIALDARRPTLGQPEVPIVPNRHIDQLRLNKLTVGMEAQNTYITSLYDPGSFATAKITILGDPDFLVMESAGSINELYSRFYGTDGYTVGANGGQVFIEIDFREAVDYDTSNGYLSINDRILFWKYPEDIPIKGVSYKVIDVMSTFHGGVFKQTLNCVINTFNNLQTTGDDSYNLITQRLTDLSTLRVNSNNTWTVVDPGPEVTKNDTIEFSLFNFNNTNNPNPEDDA
jgi:hypothetical protein